ncbi:MAG: phosphoenolpyruvate carboxylase [Candidatus Odinarchaeum yellowstonii]|uniref:Phosphoenolpyruvate carboxylase n=1 Tax=Odinarchaeota yellowstonii (strain LCB_4) TaxID=1841599 RepID=A0AAF0D3F7_ODILC|nr:MAG: phosphoenolpyruvate carboxylase [Candidatus Odinarchaeum yellowstonii]
MHIPKCMSTQHPDNVNTPFFAEESELSGDDEIQEAYYVFSHLGCDEQMWDCEGKEVDNYVVKKLITRYPSFFTSKRLGRDVFLTLRVPNPSVEGAEAKILLETLESIPRSFDAAKMFFKDDLPPIFEVILPMAVSAKFIDRIYRYYCNFVVGKKHMPFSEGDITIAEWVGDFKPEKINVIPLFEDMKRLIDCDNILREYLSDKECDYQRVFLARSDPAMNYGLVAAVILNKIALFKLQSLSEELKLPIYPIIGVGSPPFRGNMTPLNVDKVTAEYPSVQTFTVQSAFKYDYPPDQVIEGVRKIKEKKVKPEKSFDLAKALSLISKYFREYHKQIQILADVINKVSHFIPSRRKRKLHIGLFGYSRSVGNIKLPRAIPFTAALYSIGLPPELLAINSLNSKDLELVEEIYVNFRSDIKEALKYYNPDSPFIIDELRPVLKEFLSDVQICEEHKQITDQINKLISDNKSEGLKEYILQAASLRKFLG